jgi:hypothetical protein
MGDSALALNRQVAFRVRIWHGRSAEIYQSHLKLRNGQRMHPTVMWASRFEDLTQPLHHVAEGF